MYIDPFWAGIFVTIIAEIVLFILWMMSVSAKNFKK